MGSIDKKFELSSCWPSYAFSSINDTNNLPRQLQQLFLIYVCVCVFTYTHRIATLLVTDWC